MVQFDVYELGNSIITFDIDLISIKVKQINQLNATHLIIISKNT